MSVVLFLLLCICCSSVLAQDATVDFNLPANQVLFSNPINLALSIKGTQGGQIRYTINGGASTVYTGPIRIADRSVVIRANVVTNNKPGPVTLRAFVHYDPAMTWRMSNLPVVILETFGEQNFDLPDKKERPVYIVVLAPGVEAGGTPLSNDKVVFHGMAMGKVRGSSSASFEKKQFGIEFVDAVGEDQKVSVFGMPKDSKWVLYGASQFDRTWIHNAMMYQVSRDIFKRYAPRTQFVEVLLNKRTTVNDQDYQGSYTWMEKPERGEGRINVDKEGGWIIKVDRADPKEGGKDIVPVGEGSFVLDYPSAKKVTQQQLSWLTRFWTNLNAQLNSRQGGLRPPWFDSIDVIPTIDYHLMKYFTKDIDAFSLSTFLHTTRGTTGKIRFAWGPIWDFDRGLGCSDDHRCSGPDHDQDAAGRIPFGHYFWRKFFMYPQFLRRYTLRYHAMRKAGWGPAQVGAIIDRLAAQMNPSAARNIARWPTFAPEGGYLARIERLKAWVTRRFAYLDRRMCFGTPAPCRNNNPCADSICSVVDAQCYIISKTCPNPNPVRASEDMEDSMAVQGGLPNALATAETTAETTATTSSPALVVGLVVAGTAVALVVVVVVVVFVMRRRSAMKAGEIVP